MIVESRFLSFEVRTTAASSNRLTPEDSQRHFTNQHSRFANHQSKDHGVALRERSLAPNTRTTSTWNDDNRQTRVQATGVDLTAKYRYDGLRYEKAASGTTTRFVFDGQNYLLETNTSGVVQALYTGEPRTYGQLLSRRASSASRYYHFDGLGSTRIITNSSQASTDAYMYDAWGAPVVTLGSTTNPFRWVGGVGYYYDTETGLYYVRARVYSSATARWMSQDPLYYPFRRSLWYILLGSDTRLATNSFAIRLLNPILDTDPSGLDITRRYSWKSNDDPIGYRPIEITVTLKFESHCSGTDCVCLGNLWPEFDIEFKLTDTANERGMLSGGRDVRIDGACTDGGVQRFVYDETRGLLYAHDVCGFNYNVMCSGSRLVKGRLSWSKAATVLLDFQFSVSTCGKIAGEDIKLSLDGGTSHVISELVSGVISERGTDGGVRGTDH